jgi:hypothetical protein
MTMEELSNVQGRAWEDVDVSADEFPGCRLVLTFNSIDRTMNEGTKKKASQNRHSNEVTFETSLQCHGLNCM